MNEPKQVIEPTFEQDERPELFDWSPVEYQKMPLTDVFTYRRINDKPLDYALNTIVRPINGSESRVFIAGGCFRDLFLEQSPKDIDIFFKDAESFSKALGLMESNGDYEQLPTPKDFNKAVEFDYAKSVRVITFKPKDETKPSIQLIKVAWYPSAHHVIDTFDFTISQFSTDGKDFYAHPMAFLDLARKRIVLHKVTFPESTMRRLIKYTQKGFYACGGTLSSLVQGIIKLGHGEEEYLYLD